MYNKPSPGLMIGAIAILHQFKRVLILVRFPVIQPFFLADVPHPRWIVTPVKMCQPSGIPNALALTWGSIIRQRLEYQVAGAEIWSIIEVIIVQLGHHPLHEKSRLDREALDIGQYALRPL